MYNILICDDEQDIVNALKIYLSGGDYCLFEASNGREALEVVEKNDIHLILMDIMMPQLDGIAATAKLREKSNVPIILLTAKSESSDKVLGLNIGADDYITKPFSMRELLARVKANIRRTTMLSAPAAEDNAMSAGGGITINTDSFQVRKNGVPIDLTQREYELLTHGGRHRPPPARKDRGQPRRAGLHPHAPRRGLLFLRAGVSCAHFSGKGVSCYVPQPAYEARDDHAAARHLADGGGGRVFDDQRQELLY